MLLGKSERKSRFGRRGVDGRIILKGILNKLNKNVRITSVCVFLWVLSPIFVFISFIKHFQMACLVFYTHQTEYFPVCSNTHVSVKNDNYYITYESYKRFQSRSKLAKLQIESESNNDATKINQTVRGTHRFSC